MSRPRWRRAATSAEVPGIERPSEEPALDAYLYYPGTAPVPEGVAVNVRGRSYKILAIVEITDPDAAGVMFAHGSTFGGHSVSIKDRRFHYVYNVLGGIKPGQVFVSSSEFKPGKYTLGMEFERTGAAGHGASTGATKLYVDDKVETSGTMRTQPAKFTLSGDGLCIGYDSGDAVSDLYKTPGEFEGGAVHGVAVTVSGKPYVDLEAEARRMQMQH